MYYLPTYEKKKALNSVYLVITQGKGKFNKDVVRKGVQAKLKHWSSESS